MHFTGKAKKRLILSAQTSSQPRGGSSLEPLQHIGITMVNLWVAVQRRIPLKSRAGKNTERSCAAIVKFWSINWQCYSVYYNDLIARRTCLAWQGLAGNFYENFHTVLRMLSWCHFDIDHMRKVGAVWKAMLLKRASSSNSQQLAMFRVFRSYHSSACLCKLSFICLVVLSPWLSSESLFY